jgi:hypothetical protein
MPFETQTPNPERKTPGACFRRGGAGAYEGVVLGLWTPSQSPMCRPLVLALSRVPAQDTHHHEYTTFGCFCEQQN